LSLHEDDQPGISGGPSGEIGRTEAEERGSCIPDTSSCKKILVIETTMNTIQSRGTWVFGKTTESSLAGLGFRTTVKEYKTWACKQLYPDPSRRICGLIH
jgi:hypothetical protein